MKKVYFIVAILMIGFQFLYSQTFQIRAVMKAGTGEIGVEMRETSGSGTPTTSDVTTGIAFGIKWLQSLGSGLDLNPSISTNYHIIKSGTRQSKSSGGQDWYFQSFAQDAGNFNFPENWTQN